MQLSAFKFGPKKKPPTKIPTRTGAQTVSADVRAAIATMTAQQTRRQAAAQAAPIKTVERAGVFRYFDPSRTFTPGSAERAASKAWREGRLDIPQFVPESMILSDTKPEGEIMHEANTAGLSKRVLAQAQFLTWLQNRFPALASAAIEQASRGKLSGLGQMGPPATDAPVKTSFSSILDKIVTLGSTYILLDSQKKIINMNIERAKIGLAPIDIAAAGAAPVVQTEVNLSPAMIDSLKQSLGGGMQQIGLLLAIGLGAFLLLKK